MNRSICLLDDAEELQESIGERSGEDQARLILIRDARRHVKKVLKASSTLGILLGIVGGAAGGAYLGNSVGGIPGAIAGGIAGAIMGLIAGGLIGQALARILLYIVDKIKVIHFQFGSQLNGRILL